ncbi:polar amino acid ABC transporter, inner membrane subunit [Anopheles sinensis]|uniref:Polar amino acid ABC transporter, inner membrane subunit n=1 Tax=Anopheles sinensis TaxID=74873 RepID=A0A084WH95_ANOSI|nr:polar amino acid ABC transporter, inner membrane subunit [Anopheles sinensis]
MLLPPPTSLLTLTLVWPPDRGWVVRTLGEKCTLGRLDERAHEPHEDEMKVCAWGEFLGAVFCVVRIACCQEWKKCKEKKAKENSSPSEGTPYQRRAWTTGIGGAR